jgi:hypothetical protein
MKKLLLSAAALAILVAPAFAQRQKQETNPLVIEDEIKKKEADKLDQQYKRMMERSRQGSETAARTDPWANMRAPKDEKR